MPSQTLYQHTQSPLWVKAVILVSTVVPLAMFFTQTKFQWLYLTVLSIPLLMLLFYRLQVSVTEESIHLSFGIGLIKKSIPRDTISGASAVRNHWLYGWGIRLTPHGWMWNIGGLDAIELTMNNDKKFRIGTDQPEQLLQALQ